jgi:hypothetical protein
MIKKCEHIGCEKAGTCRCPKDRSLKSYWYFCQQHAAEYNKNWNYYAGMTPDEINKEWEKDMFGERGKSDPDYINMLAGFLNGGHMPARKSIPAEVAAALKTLGAGTDWPDIQKKYRALAKQNHPDTGKSKDGGRFAKISSAYQTLKKYFKK